MKFLFVFVFFCSVLVGQQNVSGAPPIAGIGTSGLLGLHVCASDFVNGATLKDISSNGNDATLVGAPTVNAANCNLVRASTQYYTLPSGIYSSYKTIQIYLDPTNGAATSGRWYAFFGSSASSIAGAISMWGPVLPATDPTLVLPTTQLSNGGGGSTKSQSLNGPSGPFLLTVVFNGAGNDQIYINDREVAYNGQASSNANTGGPLQIGADTVNSTNVQSFNGPIFADAEYNRALTAAEVAQNYRALTSYLLGRGSLLVNAPSTATTNNLLCFGDSITSGSGSLVQICGDANFTTTLTYTRRNIAIGGLTLLQLLQMGDSALLTYNPNATNTILIWAGTNDIVVSGTTVADTLRLLKAFCMLWRSRGFQVVVVTPIDRGGNSANMISYANQIRQTWRNFADGLADVAADSRMGASGANVSAVWFVGNLHPTLAAQTKIVDPILSNAINRLYSTRLDGCQTRTIPFSNEGFNVAAASADIQVALPQQFTKLTGAFVKHSTAFTATGGTIVSLTVSLGDSTGVTAYTPTFDVFQAVSTTAFQDTPLFKATTITATPPVVNAHFIATTNFGLASQTITLVNTANPVQLTATAHGLTTGNQVFITGFTGTAAAANGGFTATVTGVNTFTIPVNGAGFSLTGSPVFTSSFLTAGSVDITLCSEQVQ
jgi:hypothetical protein